MLALTRQRNFQGIDVGRLRSNQEPAANGVGESLAQDSLGLRFGGPQFAPKGGFDQLNAAELGHDLVHRRQRMNRPETVAGPLWKHLYSGAPSGEIYFL